MIHRRLRAMERKVRGSLREQEEARRIAETAKEVERIIADIDSGKIPPLTPEEADEVRREVIEGARKHFGYTG